MVSYWIDEGRKLIFGISIVRNEDDIIATTIRHHLAAGVDSILVCDNGSTDDTPQMLERLARDSRVRWLSDAGQFRQQDVVNALASDARKRGADWIVPFDADEFWHCPLGLETLLAAVPAHSDAVQGPVVNYVQQRDQIRREPSGLTRAVHRAVPVGEEADAVRGVTSGEISYVEAPYTPKVIVRSDAPHPIAAGAHGFTGPAMITVTDLVRCLHLPLRAWEVLESKVEQSQRLDEAGFPPGHGWHLRYWAQQAAAGSLDAEWDANSADPNGDLIARRGAVKLTRDDTLSRLISAAC